MKPKRFDYKKVMFFLSPVIPAACVVKFLGVDLNESMNVFIFFVSSFINFCAIWFYLISVLDVRIAMGVPAMVSAIIIFAPPAIFETIAVPIILSEFRSLIPVWVIAAWHFAGMYFTFIILWFFGIGDKIRIISARKAVPNEVKQYERKI